MMSDRRASAGADQPHDSDAALGAAGRADGPAGAPHARERRSNERRHFDELRRRLDALAPETEDLAERLPEDIALRAERDQKLSIALARTVEAAITESVRRDPHQIAAAIHPVLGPAIRQAIGESMSGLVGGINRAIAHSITPSGIRWRLESWRTGVPFAEVVLKHSLVYHIDHIFLIHAETGLLLAHVPDDGARDGSIISGMLTAIRDFVADSFEPRHTGELRRFSVGDVNLLTETGPRAYIAAVVRGVPPETLSDRLQRTLERIHLQWPTALVTFDGDAAAFEGTKPLLLDCLRTEPTTERPRIRPLFIRLARAATVLLLIAVLGAMFYRSERAWSAAVARLEQEPGIVVVKAERHGSRWKFSGLRDPAAADPIAVLASLGVDSARIDATWKPYVSGQPSLVLARANRMLRPPPDVTLTFDEETLYVSGTASPEWLARMHEVARALPGVSHVDSSGVRIAATPGISSPAVTP